MSDIVEIVLAVLTCLTFLGGLAKGYSNIISRLTRIEQIQVDHKETCKPSNHLQEAA